MLLLLLPPLWVDERLSHLPIKRKRDGAVD